MVPTIPESSSITRERPPFAMIPVALLHSSVSSRAIALYALLDDYSGDHRYAWPSISTLAEHLNCSHDSAQRAVHELELAGYLRVERRKAQRAVNRYTLLMRPRLVDNNSGSGDTGTRRSASTRTGASSGTRTGASRTRSSELEPDAEHAAEGGSALSVEENVARLRVLREAL